MAFYDADVKRWGSATACENWRFIAQLVRSAAHAVGCPVAVFFQYESDRDRLIPAASVGTDTVQAYDVPLSQLWPAQADNRTLEPLTAIDAECGNSWPLPRADDGQALSTRLAVLVPVIASDGSIAGALFLGNTEPHAPPSRAQIYVLKTHGIQIGRQMTWSQPAMVREPVRGSSDSERLRLLESVVANAKDAVLITEAEPIEDPGPRVVYCNGAFTRDTGYSEAEMLGRSPRILQGRDTDRATLDGLRAALVKWQAVEVELLNYHKDGRPFWAECSIVPVANERGRFTHWVSVQRDISERRRAEEVASQVQIAESERIALEAKLAERDLIEKTLTHAAFHDHLTQLRNRAFVMDLLASLLSSHGRRASDEGGHVLFLDLDRFKSINDCLGHRAGDQLLTEMARRLEKCVREGDTLARVSGDEFVIVQAAAPDPDAAATLAERIQARLQSPFRIQGHDLFISASIGIVDVGPSYRFPEELLRDADIAMYASKFKGPGQYSVFTEAMRADVQERLQLQIDLRRALDAGELTIEYQPTVDMQTGTVHGLEALARWQHAERGIVPPSVFIAIAEDIGIVDTIDNWLLSQACRQVADWNRSAVERPLRLSTNVSVRELRQHDFVERLQTVLDQSGLSAELLQLEITENLFLQDARIVAELIATVHALGVQIALDDFGTGYSSLAHIDQYEIDAIKIDRHFIQGMRESRRTMAIVQMIISLGEALDVEIVAEGVETEEQRATLQALGCPLAQGHLLARPMSSVEIERYLIQDG